jgi:hypothetical protein
VAFLLRSIAAVALVAVAATPLPAVGAPASPAQVDVSSGSVVEAITKLKPGQYVWAPQVAPEGPTLLIVNVSTQRATLFRNGVPIGASTISTGRPGHETPTGVFTVLQKQVEHHSSKYDDAPMPWMQRLTWYGVALHAGNLPGYPASHGCIRLPAGFAKLLYGVTALGMTVVITDKPITPRIAPVPGLLASAACKSTDGAVDYEWFPGKSPQGPVSIVVSTADGKARVLRNGVEIGSARVTVDGTVSGTSAYELRNVDATGRHWIRVSLSQAPTADQPVSTAEWRRFNAPEGFRRAVAAIVQPGTTLVVTSDSLTIDASGKPVPVLDAEMEAKPR